MRKGTVYLRSRKIGGTAAGVLFPAHWTNSQNPHTQSWLYFRQITQGPPSQSTPADCFHTSRLDVV